MPSVSIDHGTRVVGLERGMSLRQPTSARDSPYSVSRNIHGSFTTFFTCNHSPECKSPLPSSKLDEYFDWKFVDSTIELVLLALELLQIDVLEVHDKVSYLKYSLENPLAMAEWNIYAV